jgi:aminocarboxymuconate-semialdehyde decarboxylase
MSFGCGSITKIWSALSCCHASADAGGGRVTRRFAGKVIDTHAHWYPEEWIRAIEKEGAAHGAGIARQDGKVTFSAAGSSMSFTTDFVDLEQRIAAMNQAGVDMHALSLTTPMVYWAPPAFGLKLAEIYNEAASAAHLRYPDRFVGMATLPMQAPDLALRELERAAKLPGLRGLYLATHVNGNNLDEKAYFPIYAKCEALGWPVFLHPMNPLAPERLKRFYLINFLGNPYETGVAAASLVFGGALDAFPKLEVMLPHAGGTFPALIGRLDHGTRVRAELKHMKQLPSSYLRRFSYDTIGHNDQILLNLVRMVGADRIVLGSDYCFDMGYDRPVEVVEKLDVLSATDRDLILGRNAARLLGL